MLKRVTVGVSATYKNHANGVQTIPSRINFAINESDVTMKLARRGGKGLKICNQRFTNVEY